MHSPEGSILRFRPPKPEKNSTRYVRVPIPIQILLVIRARYPDIHFLLKFTIVRFMWLNEQLSMLEHGT
jgi:hypothetical protein